MDSDWAANNATSKSNSGYTIMMSGAPLSWSSSQQEVIALSRAKAEYVSLCSGTKEEIWLRRLCSGICDISKLSVQSFVRIMVEPMTVHVNSQGCIDLAPNRVMKMHTKHIDI